MTTDTQQQSDGKTQLDWHMSKLHEVIISPCPKEDKLAAYAAWANGFDKDVLSQGYSSPLIMTEILFKLTDASEVSILDVGCGTGLVAPPFVEMAKTLGKKLNFVGLDYSQEMLDVAEPKKLYTSLVKADITETLPLPDKSFDFFISGGVFVAGHCGPEVLPNIMKVVKMGGYAIFTVRKNTFDEATDEYLTAFKAAGCEIVENNLHHYLGPVQSYITVLRKVAHV